MLKKLALFLIVLMLFAVRPAMAAEKDYYAESFDVAIAIQPNGDMLVTETVVFHFIGGPFTFAFRTIPIEKMDAIRDLSAALDGQPLPEGDQAGQVEFEQGERLVVTWHFRETSDAAHTLTLSYRVIQAIEKQERLDVLDWDALPNEHEYAIRSSRVSVSLPEGLSLAGEPLVLRAQAQAALEGRSVVFTSQGLGADAPLEIYIPFPAGSLASQKPAWQIAAEELQQARQQASRAGWAAGLVALAGGLVGIGLFRRRSDRNAGSSGGLPQTAFQAESQPTSPPGDLPAALAGALANPNASANWVQGLAALFELARQGSVHFEEQQGLGGLRRDFSLHLDQRPEQPRLHQQVLLNLIFKMGLPGDATPFLELSSRLTSGWTEVQRAIDEELQSAGLLSPIQRQASRRLNVFSLLAVFLGLLGALGMVFLSSKLPGAGKIISGALAGLLAGVSATGVIGTLYASNYPVLTDQGKYQLQQWRGFANYMKKVASGKETAIRSDFFDHYLPYAATFGLAKAWTRRFRKVEGLTLPVWFHALNPQDFDSGMNSLAGMMDSATSAGSSDSGGGGGGDGGGGGGGSSGAG